MKFTVVSALIGASNTLPMQQQSTSLDDQCKEMSAMCNVPSLAEIETSNLIQLRDDDHGVGSHVNNIKESSEAHFGKTKEAINAENKKILDTQKQCLDFVSQHPDHPEVCNWCHESFEPTDPWQWNPSEGVWYKWSNGQYHYWGPSKDGLKHEWSWYNGYWHHGGYVFKYEGGKW
jgi:hypothetical protein